jgi:salicylate hydroxylase
MVWPYKVRVIGAGIAGLSFAVALIRKARSCGLRDIASTHLQIDEASPGPSTDGAGIQLGPNIVRLLKNDLGLQDVLKSVGFAPQGIRLSSLKTAKQLARLPLQDFEQRYGASYLTIHRAALQSALLNKLHETGQAVNWSRPFEGAKDSKDTQVSGLELGIDCSTFQQDRTNEPLLLVGADGRRSVCRNLFVEDTTHAAQRNSFGGEPFYTGQIALRSLLTSLDHVPREQREDITVWVGPGHHLVGYPIFMPTHQGVRLYYNLVGFIEGPKTNTDPNSETSLEREGWSSLAGDEQIGNLLDALNPSLHWIKESTQAWSSWPLWASPVIQTPANHYKKYVFLIGDAAHAMRPHQAQGSAMAVEDACALARHLTSGGGSLHERCLMAAKERWARNARVQRQSIRNGKIFQFTGPMAWFRDRALQFAGSQLMDQPWLFRDSRIS